MLPIQNKTIAYLYILLILLLSNCAEKPYRYAKEQAVLNKFIPQSECIGYKSAVFLPEKFCLGCNKLLYERLNETAIPLKAIFIIQDTLSMPEIASSKIIFDRNDAMTKTITVGYQPLFLRLNIKGEVISSRSFNTENYLQVIDSLFTNDKMLK